MKLRIRLDVILPGAHRQLDLLTQLIHLFYLCARGMVGSQRRAGRLDEHTHVTQFQRQFDVVPL